ncbi:MAG: alkaline phosphatase D family protein [Planctomycetota bacterium]
MMVIRPLATLVCLYVGLGVQTANAGEDFSKAHFHVAPKDRICFALYTVHAHTLKLTAQFYPIKNFEPFNASLQVKQDGEWVTRATADISYPGYTATFRINDWDDSKKQEYRVTHNATAFYRGIIRRNPQDKQSFIMAAFTGNSIDPGHGGDIPRADIVENLKKLEPDLLFFSGDQVYDHSEHLLFWLKFGRDFGEVISNTPTVCLPDDHDVGQANLWGADGKRCGHRNGIEGGYYMPVAYVQEVERAQTSHLPDPFDPTPIDRGIGVYYTGLTWGGISFAILEDRKFKSGPGAYVKRNGKPTDSITERGVDTRQYDAPGAKLLGDRQLKFLEAWTTDWKDAEMKCVLSQTIFAQGCNYSGKHEKELKADFDSNGWPQTGRDRALAVIRKSYACMVAGDQHLGTLIHHGIDEWRDAGYSFCVPSIANYWLRWWDPSEAGKNKKPDSPDYTGDFYDGFRNKITMLATANPTTKEKQEGGKLSTRAAGFGVVKFDKLNRTITFECWPRNTDITDPASKQYSGWPVTISQADNYAMENGFLLPRLEVSESDQVVSIVDASDNHIVTSLRLKGQTIVPKVPRPGKYHVAVGDLDNPVWIRNLESSKARGRTIRIDTKQTRQDSTSSPQPSSQPVHVRLRSK